MLQGAGPLEQLVGRERADEHDCGGIVDLDLAPMGLEQPVQGLCRYTVDTAGVLEHTPRGAVVAKLDGARRAGEDARARSKKHRLRHNDDAEASTEEDTQPGGPRAEAALGGDGRDGTRGVGKRAPHDEQTQRALKTDNHEDGIVAYMRVAQRRDRTSALSPSCPWTPARKRR